MTDWERLELEALRQLEELAYQRRAMEPEHSREDHECRECEVLADARVYRRAKERGQ